ncbi:GNAT family N-acetyltransferase [Legionella bononiensis]|uniref:GNAT family N-acetyltransferase n=1 Tax=Legionella bononiensis TaxID=2793102 RepID=A0ABS1WBT4_9GAMM|nr:GNAT family N-acetyltransferase [Legionella bononiensis]MBL7481108.1 GNAT family N-acetyltransferase [Legionella bononiensis]MBL7526817.1 GNAT family N-acetyltransferase [Legionella bononiensis]MBL7564224.1 GNAT family N-acetyltransferase [Legionella bononiensis]
MNSLETSRLILRDWKDEDVSPFFLMNQDPKVMEYFPGVWTMDMVHSFITRMKSQLVNKGFTLWAVEEKETQAFIGFIGLNAPSWEAHFTPCVEIGWRLASSSWGKGYATEGAQAVLEFAFHHLKLKKVVSFTVPDNLRSRRVMEKIGMTRVSDGDFLHPNLEPSHPLARHVLYVIQSEQ